MCARYSSPFVKNQISRQDAGSRIHGTRFQRPVRCSPAASGSDEAVSGVADFTPGAIAYGIAGKEWAIHGGELDPNPNRLFALREFARDEKFVVAKSAIGGLLSGEHQWDPRPS